MSNTSSSSPPPNQNFLSPNDPLRLDGSSNGDHISNASLDFLAKLTDAEPTHGLLVPSKKRTNSNFAYTMILRGHTYHVCYRRQTPRGERVYWRCQLRGQCKARLITDLEGKIVQFTNPVHSHPSSTRLNSQQQRCIQALLTKVEESVDFLNGASNGTSLAHQLPPSSSPDNDEFPILANGSSAPNIFESANTSGTLSSSNGDVPLPLPSSSNHQQQRKRSKNASKGQQTGELDIEEVLRQIPQLRTLHFASYYNNNQEDDEEDDENNNESAGEEHPQQPQTIVPTATAKIKSKQALNETDETVYEDTDSSSVASPNHLADSQRRVILETLQRSGWNQVKSTRDTIRKTFEFVDFNEAFGFMQRAAMKAEALNRHPEWTNDYNRVEIRLPASSAPTQLTIGDLQLAKFMDEIYHV
ncbi:4a-hydroxytetrahydrobiopterin dehydratase [Aphelenchoides bicaudatus]|nr:4a-hydroxytetrahydrobiopterin dehydratase [Aphelenchoides bicaudatus]